MSAYPLVRNVKNKIRSMIRKIISQPDIRNNIINNLIQDYETRQWLIHQLAMYETRQKAEFDQAPLDQFSEIQGFEDCYWLFSSNELNQSLSQLRFDDAAYLYQQLLGYEHPRIAELGRYKGGTAFLLAAAGAEVLSLEFNSAVHERYLPSLKRALDHFGLTERVDARFGDAYTYKPGQENFDFVLVHCSPPSYERTRELVKHWWPFICVGGYLILHETPFLPGEQTFIDEMRSSVEVWQAELKLNTPGENVYFKKLGELDQP
jgi:hypothetical protein